MSNYYDMSGEAASASAQQTTGAENGPTADTVGGEQDNNVQKLPPGTPSMKNGFKLQAYLGLVDRDFDLALQLAQVATRQRLQDGGGPALPRHSGKDHAAGGGHQGGQRSPGGRHRRGAGLRARKTPPSWGCRPPRQTPAP